MVMQLSDGATILMTVFVVMSGAAMLIVALTAALSVASFTISGTSLSIDTGLDVLGFLLGKIWKASLLQMLAFYNCVGGGAAFMIGALLLVGNGADEATHLPETLIGALIGGISMSGSLIAWAKCGRFNGKPIRTGSLHAISTVVLAIVLGLAVYLVLTGPGGDEQLIAKPGLVFGLLVCALLMGALMSLPLHTGRVPIVMSIYNALAGFAIGLEGVAIHSPVLIIAGIIVGTGRAVMTILMAGCETGNVRVIAREDWSSYLRVETEAFCKSANSSRGR